MWGCFFGGGEEGWLGGGGVTPKHKDPICFPSHLLPQPKREKDKKR